MSARNFLTATLAIAAVLSLAVSFALIVQRGKQQHAAQIQVATKQVQVAYDSDPMTLDPVMTAGMKAMGSSMWGWVALSYGYCQDKDPVNKMFSELVIRGNGVYPTIAMESLRRVTAETATELGKSNDADSTAAAAFFGSCAGNDILWREKDNGARSRKSKFA